MKQRPLFFVILGSLVIYLLLFFCFHKDIYLHKFNSDQIEERYFNSSYGKNRAEYILSDEELYIAEGHFLINKNQDLHKLNAGHPPFGKYLIGLSLKFFQNPYWFSALFGVVSLLFFFLIGLELGLPPVWAIIVTSFLCLESLFLEQFSTSLLDIYLITLCFVSLFFYLRAFKNQKSSWIIISHFFLGLAMATKFFPTAVPLVVALVSTTVLSGNFSFFKKYILTLPFMGLGFVLGHITYFFYHPSILEFIRYNRYVISWWAGSPQVPPLQVWDLVFRNRWHTWWENQEVITTPYWWVAWPIVFGLATLSPLLSFIIHRRPRLPTLGIYLWFIFSMLLFSFEAIYPRHLLLALPPAYLLVASLLTSL